MRSVLTAALAILFLTAPASAQQNAREATIRAEIATTKGLTPKVADRAAANFLLATDYAALGDRTKALTLLKQAIESDEGFDPGATSFASLQSEPQYQALVRRAAQKFPAIHQAILAFTVVEKDLIPEGLTFNPSAHTFYLGSLKRRKIVEIKNGVANDFVPADRDQLLPVLGMKIDPADSGLWANTGSDSSGKSELVHFDRQGKLLGRWKPPGSGKHLLNDVVLRGAQEIFVSDSLANQIYRFDRKSGTFTELPLFRPLYYPNGIAISHDGNQLFVADAFGILRVGLIDHSSAELSPPTGSTLAGVDGMYWDRGDLVVVQNVGSPRLARFLLSKDGLRVTNSTILEYRSEFVELPTTGVIVDGKFYFICNSQIENLQNEKVVDSTKLRPVRIGVVALP
jgi:sugar lactone lactonase YvrE